MKVKQLEGHTHGNFDDEGGEALTGGIEYTGLERFDEVVNSPFVTARKI